MYIARILYPVKVLGPGKRVGIWFSGCEHQCCGCSNPELWEQRTNQKISISGLCDVINTIKSNYEIDGFTLTGGDPFMQPDALRELLPKLYSITEDILVYTGYMYEELEYKHKDILDWISVLIDGKYVETKNYGAMLKGSNNQRIIYLNGSMEEKYSEYLSCGKSQIQNFETSDGLISVGIHFPEYEEKLRDIVKRKGLEESTNG